MECQNFESVSNYGTIHEHGAFDELAALSNYPIYALYTKIAGKLYNKVYLVRKYQHLPFN